MAGWQYLQQPEAIAAELWRITRPKGQVIVAFSNRMFFTKAPQIWTDGDDRDHLRYVSSVLMAQGWPQPEIVAETTRGGGVMGLFGGKGDPFFAVVATKPWAEQSALLNRVGRQKQRIRFCGFVVVLQIPSPIEEMQKSRHLEVAISHVLPRRRLNSASARTN